MPAIMAMCEVMPADARGEIAILVPDQADAQSLTLPVGVRCHWFVGEPESSGLLEHVIALPLVRDGGFFWLGGKRRWCCRCAAIFGLCSRWIVSHSTPCRTGAGARVKRPITRPVTM